MPGCRTTTPGLLALLPLLGLGCAEGPGAEVGPRQIDSDAGLYALTLTLTPDPPEAGPVEVEVELLSEGAPVTGAALDVEPWMPSMGHGIASPPEVAEAGDGHYLVEFVLNMPGTWELRLHIKADPGEDDAVVAYEVR